MVWRFVLALLASTLAAARKPNILLMMADQMRGDLVASDILELHNINSIGESGIRFEKAYSSTPTCTPARAAILTGRKPWNHGMLGYGDIAPTYPLEMPRASKELAGYHTAVVGKDHFGRNRSVTHGYQWLEIYDGALTPDDEYHQWFHRFWDDQPVTIGWPGIDANCWKGRPYALREEFHPTAWVGRVASEWLKENGTKLAEQDTPWLLKVSFHRPHSPYSPPLRFLKQVTSDKLPPIRTATDGWDARYNGSTCGPRPRGCDQWCGQMPAREMTLGRRAYRAEALFVDHWVGNLLAVLNETGLAASTLLLWTSDHGDCQGDHFLHRKGYPYQCATSIPMLLRWPPALPLHGVDGRNVRRGSVISEEVVELRDILPTFMEAAGVSEGAGRVDGRSMLCFLTDQCKDWRAWLDLEHNIVYNTSVHWNALTDGKTKFVFEALTGSEQLFDLGADPYELRDLAQLSQYKATMQLWRRRLLRQWQLEGRGSTWYDSEGNLLPRERGQQYSPHYPHQHTASEPAPLHYELEAVV